MTNNEALRTILSTFPGSKVIAGGFEKEVRMAESHESPFSITFKTGRSTLITVRGDTASALADNLASMSDPLGQGPDGPETVISVLKAIESEISGSSAAPSGGSGGGSSSQQASLTPVCKVCNGPTTEKSGNGRRGPWKGYFCDTNKDHEVQWAKA